MITQLGSILLDLRHGPRAFAGLLVLLGTMMLAGAPATATAENLQGNAKGFITTPLGLTQNGAPLLQSFYFRFRDDDHHYGGMEVQPNMPALNKASIGFSDKNGDDRYFYNITFAPYFGEISRNTTTEFGRKKSITFPVKVPASGANSVFVIRGFYLQYRGGDHHIDEIGIQEQNGQVTVTLNDHNDDDPFRIDLSYAYIPRSRFSEVGQRSGSAKGGQRATIPSGTAVIRGFRFNFNSDDRHIREIGVVLNGGGRLEVFYSDNSQNDLFAWDVAYGILRP
jgi:hypothetical protein